MSGAFARMQLTPYNPQRSPPPPLPRPRPKKQNKKKTIVKNPKVIKDQLQKRKKIVWRKLM